MYSHCCHARSTQTQRAEEWVLQVSLIASYLKLPFSAEPSFSLLSALPVHHAGQHFSTKQNSPCPHLTDISGVLSTNFRVPSPKPGSRTSLVTDTPFVHQNVDSRKLKQNIIIVAFISHKGLGMALLESLGNNLQCLNLILHGQF